MLAMLKPKKPPAIDKDQASRTAESRALVELKATFESDADFRAALQRLKADRSITREGLNRLFCELFDRSRPLTTKATREKLVQDIADLRLERVRSKRAAEYFSGKVA